MRGRDSQCLTMRCPRCHSLNVRRSRRRIWERGITLLLSSFPFRCRSCQGRFWRRRGALLNLPRLIAFGIATTVMAVFAIRTLGLLHPPPLPAAATSRVAAAGEPVPAPGPRRPARRPDAPAEADSGTPRGEVERATGAPPATPEPAAKSAEERPVAQLSSTPPAEAAVVPAEKPAVVPPEKPSVLPPPTGAAEASSSWELREIRGEAGGGLLEIQIVAGQPIRDFRSFTLEEPRRIVLDLPGVWVVRGTRVVDLGHHLASRIRIGDHAEKLRLVIDVALDTARQPHIEPSDEGLTVRISPISLRPLPL